MSGKLFIIGIYTCPKYQERVDGQRGTWIKLLPENYRVIHVMARPGEPPALEGDTMFVDCQEAYEHLAEKSHLFFKFCTQNLEFDYIFKTDDDTYLDLSRFLAFDLQGADYVGRFRDEPLDERGQTWHYGKCSDKSFEVPSESEFKCGWALGGGYFVSKKAAELLVKFTKETFQTSLFEDKMVGEALTMAPTIKVVRTDYSALGVINPLLPKDMVYIHDLINERNQLSEENRVLKAEHTQIDTESDAEVKFGSLRSFQPVSKCWGYDRGTPIDRYYMESFLESNARRIHGWVLEIKDAAYTQKYGQRDVEVSDILDIDENNLNATLVTDVSTCDGVQSNTYDCVIFTQTLQYVFSPQDALASMNRILKPGGTLLLTCPAITKVEFERLGDSTYWSFTEASLNRMLAINFAEVDVSGHGNLVVATAFLHGLTVEDLRMEELDYRDPDYPILITARATKRS